MSEATDLLWQWCRFGWAYRHINERPAKEKDWIAERVRYEMNLIIEKDFVDFFLMVSDVIRFAKDNGVPVGPARGSSAASVVCYLLRITEVDPSKYPMMLFLPRYRTKLPI